MTTVARTNVEDSTSASCRKITMQSTSAPAEIKRVTYDDLVEFLKRALSEDPVCACGCRRHRHSDDGPCYGCGYCDYFVEKK